MKNTKINSYEMPHLSVLLVLSKCLKDKHFRSIPQTGDAWRIRNEVSLNATLKCIVSSLSFMDQFLTQLLFLHSERILSCHMINHSGVIFIVQFQI